MHDNESPLVRLFLSLLAITFATVWGYRIVNSYIINKENKQEATIEADYEDDYEALFWQPSSQEELDQSVNQDQVEQIFSSFTSRFMTEIERADPVEYTDLYNRKRRSRLFDVGEIKRIVMWGGDYWIGQFHWIMRSEVDGKKYGLEFTYICRANFGYSERKDEWFKIGNIVAVVPGYNRTKGSEGKPFTLSNWKLKICEKAIRIANED